jgi:hypothetical protein
MKTFLWLWVLLAVQVCGGETRIQVEAGPAWFSRNDVRIPGDTGDRFDLLDLTGEGPDQTVRLVASYAFSKEHAIRVTLAPLEVNGTGTFDAPTQFEDTLFAPDLPTKATYAFNTYRIGYRWTFHHEGPWTLGVGGVVLVRDAEISLEQGGVKESNTDLGVVPLFGFYADHQTTERLSFHFDAEGLASPYGRAFDIALQAHWAINDTWDVIGSLRTIEGGADNDDVYTFAWIRFAQLGVAATF